MLYNLAIVIYDFIVHLAAPFSRKPRKMMKGHWVVYELLRQQVEKGEQYIWFHAASLGEFEQGRPLIEMIRAKYPAYKILLTFFSPSGYEVRKHYRGADIVCYLPFDKPRNVRKFQTSTARLIRAIVSSLPNTQEISNICGPFPSPTNVRRKAFMILPVW